MKKLRVIIWNLVNVTAALRSAAIFTLIHLVFCFVCLQSTMASTSGCTRTVRRVYSNKRLHLISALCSSTRLLLRLIGSLLLGFCFIETMRDAAKIPRESWSIGFARSLHSLCYEANTLPREKSSLPVGCQRRVKPVHSWETGETTIPAATSEMRNLFPEWVKRAHKLMNFEKTCDHLNYERNWVSRWKNVCHFGHPPDWTMHHIKIIDSSRFLSSEDCTSHFCMHDM